MMNSLLGIKRNMTATYDARGRRVGATVVEVLPNFVTALKTKDGKDGYNSVQLGTGVKKSVNKPQIGQLKKAGIEQKVRWLREIRTDEVGVNLGQSLELGQVFSIGDSVKVTGISKGKGFQGGVRRHGFAGGPKTHGQSDRHRAPGSIGQTTTPGRVYKGKKMAGHMGVDTVSVRGLEVVSLDKKNNLLVLKGAVPGFAGGLVTITKLGRIKGYTPPPEEKPDEEEVLESSQENSGEKALDQTVEVKVEEQSADAPVSQDTAEKQGDQS